MRKCSECKYCAIEPVLPGTGLNGRNHYYFCKYTKKTVYENGACGIFKAKEEQ